MALMRLSVLINMLFCVRSGNTGAAGCLLLLFAEKPDLESEMHIMNQTDCVEMRILLDLFFHKEIHGRLIFSLT